MMRKILSLLIFLSFVRTGVYADRNFLTCPVSVQLSEAECHSLIVENAENEDPKELFRNKFDDVYEKHYLPVLNHIKTDHRSNPNFLSQKAIYELRVHKKCLRTVCDEIFSQCHSAQDIQSGNFGYLKKNQENCRDLMDYYFEIRKNQLTTEVIENQYRKNRSLLKQKLTALSTRFQVYMLPLLTKTARELKRLEGKIDSYVNYPKK